MSDLHNKKIILGVSGGIAAYKAAELCRLLIKQGAEVRVVMSAAARKFIQPLTFQALSGHPVYSDLFDADAANAMDHIELARWSDLLLIAPATANTLARLVHGDANNLLQTIALAQRGRIAVAPAMNRHMFAHPATEQNLYTLRQRGVHVWGPDSGQQACGDVGPGRMLEAETLMQHCVSLLQPGRLQGKRVLITAGPTREAIDPVRYLSNRSSGKMGYSLAKAARDAGAEVTLVSGPVCLSAPADIELIHCESAQQMHDRVLEQLDGQDIFIASAAVADYSPVISADHKIKKSASHFMLELQRTPDILATVSTHSPRPFCVGFAAETQDLLHYADEKLRHKRLNMIAANRVDRDDSGFDNDNNALTVLWPGGSRDLKLKSKTLIAHELMDIICEKYRLSKSGKNGPQ